MLLPCSSQHDAAMYTYEASDHVTLNFNKNMSTAAVFLDIEKAFDTTWHLGLLYKLSKLQFSTNLIKLISSFLSQRNYRVSVEGEMSTPRYMQAGVPRFRPVPYLTPVRFSAPLAIFRGAHRLAKCRRFFKYRTFMIT
jgi:hypothetical protein